MVALASPTLNESYVESSPYAWLRSRTPVPTTCAPACDPLYPFQEILENRSSRARGITGNCTQVVERKFAICIEIWLVELESCVWRVSFHKYAYVHGDPIQGIDPTGKWLGGLGVVALWGGAIGGTLGAVRGFVDGVLDPDASWEDVIYNTVRSAIFGAAFGAGIAATGAYLAGISASLSILAGGGFLAVGTFNNAFAIKESFAQGKDAQGYGRIAFAALDLIMGGIALNGMANARSGPAPAAGQTGGANQGWLGGSKVDGMSGGVFWVAMRMLGVKIIPVPKGTPISPRDPSGVASYNPRTREIRVREGEYTFYQIIHEMFHAVHHFMIGDKYLSLLNQTVQAPGPNGQMQTLYGPVLEGFVYSRVKDLFWGFMNSAEQQNANWYISKFGKGTDSNP
jgi:hypothetical protein